MGGPTLLKGALDRAGSALLLLLVAPLLVGIAIAVRRDGGPALVLQERVGLDGRTFRLLMFRSMSADRSVTRIGALLRRYSLDVLPQLLNVLSGSMSLVGPRPPLPHEVADDEARRRLAVKPGMTGLWQLSGRRDLCWDEMVRLDQQYVENWTLALDAHILARSVRGALRD